MQFFFSILYNLWTCWVLCSTQLSLLHRCHFKRQISHVLWLPAGQQTAGWVTQRMLEPQPLHWVFACEAKRTLVKRCKKCTLILWRNTYTNRNIECLPYLDSLTVCAGFAAENSLHWYHVLDLFLFFNNWEITAILDELPYKQLPLAP